MAMLRAGAYSKKFQNLERERVRQLKEQEKANRGKAQLYSQQTTQRQKALEEKKRAMVVAEEDRRRKALEERREAQKQATKRFRSAIGRIRSGTKGHGQMVTKDSQTALNFYLPDKPKPKGAPSQSQKAKSTGTHEVQNERVAIGKDVEIKLKAKNGYHRPHQVNGLQQRTPSLDDVLRQIKRERKRDYNQEPPVNHGRIHVHQRVPDMLVQPQNAPSMGRRSASDPSLNLNQMNEKPTTHGNQIPHNHTSAAVKDSSGRTLSSHATSNLHHVHRNFSDDSIVFQHVDNIQSSPMSKMEDDLQVTSPDNGSSSTESLSGDSMDEPLFSDIPDSLSTETSVSFTIGNGEPHLTHQAEARKEPDSLSSKMSFESYSNSHTSINSSPVPPKGSLSPGPVGNYPSPAGQQPIYVCEDDDVASIDSLEEDQGPNQTKAHRKRVPSLQSLNDHIVTSIPVSAENEVKQQNRSSLRTATSKSGVKPVVGILKKSNSNTQVTSRMNSTSTLKGNDDTESTKTQKKVRFSDQVETSKVTSGVQKKSSNFENELIDPARIDLWKRVLPNGVTSHYLPNSAFTPKMKVSLSSKASTSQPISGPPSKAQAPNNGITLHIPVATTDSSPRSSPTPRQSDSASNDTKQQVSNEEHQVNHKLSNASVSLSGVAPAHSNAEKEPFSKEKASDTDKALKQISLEKTPTDDDINHLWDQIRHALQNNQKVSVPPQVFNFRIHPDSSSKHGHESSSTGSVTSHTSTNSLRDNQRSLGPSSLSGAVRKNASAERFYSRPAGDVPSTQRGAPQRQTNLSRPTRCQTNAPHQPVGRRGHSHTATYPVSSRQDHSVMANRTQPSVQISSAEPELVVRTTGNNLGRKPPTVLSLEEQRLMLSIEHLNQQIKGHITRHPGTSKFQSPVSPEPPDFTPEYYPHPPPSPTPPQRHRGTSTHPHKRPHSYTQLNNRGGGYSDLPNTRVRRNPKSVASMADHSRTQNRRPAHKQFS